MEGEPVSKKLRMTEKRLDVIISALAHYETIIDDGEGWLWETDVEYRRRKHDCVQAQVWAHQQLNNRQTRKGINQ